MRFLFFVLSLLIISDCENISRITNLLVNRTIIYNDTLNTEFKSLNFSGIKTNASEIIKDVENGVEFINNMALDLTNGDGTVIRLSTKYEVVHAIEKFRFQITETLIIEIISNTIIDGYYYIDNGAQGYNKEKLYRLKEKIAISSNITNIYFKSYIGNKDLILSYNWFKIIR